MIGFSFILVLLYVFAILWLLLGLLGNNWVGVEGVAVQEVNGISVIVAFRNESERLPGLLGSLQSQDFPDHLWEAILVDDGSTDCGPELLSEHAQQLPIKLLKLRENRFGKKQAILLGLSQAKFNTIVFTDADCTHPPQWLSTIAAQMDYIDFLQGNVKPLASSRSVVSWFEALDYAALMAVSAGSFGMGRPVIASSANLAIKRSLIKVDERTIRADVPSGDDMFLLHHAKTIPGLRLGFKALQHLAVETSFTGGFKGFIERRARWASKASAYTDIDTILLASLVFALNFWIVLLLFATVSGFVGSGVLLSLWLVKMFTDFVFLSTFLFKTHQQKLLLVFVPLQLIYPLYITFSAIAGLLIGVTWKGRTID